jgi:hypothetical protein
MWSLQINLEERDFSNLKIKENNLIVFISNSALMKIEERVI